MTYTDQQLLEMACKMLEVAKDDQLGLRGADRDRTWLVNNKTLEAIQQRVNIDFKSDGV